MDIPNQIERLNPNQIKREMLNSEWPCLKTMKKARLIILVMVLMAFFAFCFVSYLNYQINLNTYIETKKIADFVTNNLEVYEEDSTEIAR